MNLPRSIALRGVSALMCCTVVPIVTPSAASAATASHTGSAAAVHMQLKDLSTGTVVCNAYDTPASSPPVAQDCPTGDWTEQLFDIGWGQIGDNTPVTVGGGDTPPSSPASHTGSAAAVHMQLKDLSTGTVVCNAYDTPASSPPVAQDCPTGDWTEQLFDIGWGQIGDNTPVTVGGGGGTTPGGDPEPSDGYRRIFTENFDGSSLPSDWDTPDWPESYRDADYRRDQCVVSGGQLTVQASLDGDQVAACYAISDQTFGPGSGQINVQYRVNLSRVQAEGGWFAAWLNTLSSEGDPYDGDPATGTEIDVLEYLPFDGGYQFSENGIDTRNSFHPAVHIDRSGGFNAPDTNGNGFFDAGRVGVDLQSGWHTFGLEWNGDCQVFSVDGNAVWTNRDGVSSAEVHRLLLTMEMDSADADGYNLWGLASGDFADNLRDRPAEALVDWVRVDQKSVPDAGLCDG